MRPAPDVADLVRFAVEAERAGLDAVMVSEHIVLGPSRWARARGRSTRGRRSGPSRDISVRKQADRSRYQVLDGILLI